jgi:hypothetical protein
MESEPLPFLIRHGAAVWMAALAALVLSSVLLARFRRRFAASREASARREALGAPEGRLDGAGGLVVTLEGRLLASGAACARFEDGGEVAAASAGSGRTEAIVATRAERLELVTPGAVVLLEGPIDVIVGDVEARTGLLPEQLDPAVRARIEEAGGVWASPEPAVLRSIASGATVRARGTLLRGDAGEGPGGYRTGGGALRLVPPPVGDDGVPAGIRLAYAGVPRGAEASRRVQLRAAAYGALVFAAVFVLVPALFASGPIPTDRRAQLLAATPLHRKRAVAGYTEMLDAEVRRGPPDPALIERLVTARLAAGGCEQAVRMLMDHGRFARAEAIAQGCGKPLLAARAAFERGDFEAAARAWDAGAAGVTDGLELLFGLRAHLLAGHVREAAAVARRTATQLRDLDRSELDCLADALAARAGDRAAAEALERRPSGFACFALRADLRDGPARAELLRNRDWDYERTYNLLALEAGQTDNCAPWIDGGDPVLGSRIEAQPWGLLRAALDRLDAAPAPTPHQRVARARLAEALAVFDADLGAHAEAYRLAERAAADAASIGQPEARFGRCIPDHDAIRRLPTAVLLRAGRIAEVRPRLAALDTSEAAQKLVEITNMRAGSPPPRERLRDLLGFGKPRLDAVDFAVSAGDGVRLSRLYQEEGLPMRPSDLRLTAYAADTPASREALVRWLRWGTSARCQSCTVGARIQDLSARLAAAEALGDAALLAEIAPIAAGWRTALLRRETAVPLAVLERLDLRWIPPTELALGDRHSCARFGDRRVRCWGANDHGQIGDGTAQRRTSPTPVPGLDDVVDLAAARDETCALRGDGAVLCWGRGMPSPKRVAQIPRAKKIVMGAGGACALVEGGTLNCWRGLPPLGMPPEALTGVADLAAGKDHVCMLRDDGTVWCWGENEHGQLGDGTTYARVEPTRVEGLDHVVHLAAGDKFTCASRRDPTETLCWGAGTSGQLGNDERKDLHAPSPKRDRPLLRWSPAPLALGGAFACALDGDVVKCWGATARGQVGDGKLTGQDAPVSLGFCGVAQVAAGSAHACMRTRSGEIWCWGLNHDGQLGDGTTEGRPRPIFIPL